MSNEIKSNGAKVTHTVEQIRWKVEEAIDRLFFELQEKEGVTTGDIEPFEQATITALSTSLATVIREVLDDNK